MCVKKQKLTVFRPFDKKIKNDGTVIEDKIIKCRRLPANGGQNAI